MKKITVKRELKKITRPINVVHISTYIPRKCGLATFTKDLTNAMNQLNPAETARIIALDDPASEPVVYPPEVVRTISQMDPSSYTAAAAFINKNRAIDVVSVQHEFGIFGGVYGENVELLYSKLKKPILTTLHTVLQQPSDTQQTIIQFLAKRSKFIVVMLNKSKEILMHKYGLTGENIVVIAHGVPDFPHLNTDEWKAKLGLSGHTIMSSINLISESKGLEYAIESLPQIIAHDPTFKYLIIGETHPGYLRGRRGQDAYRKKLQALVSEKKLDDHVVFINKYLHLDEVVAYIGASDFYITPYLDPQQVASGSLSYAVGAGRVCIATPYLYAQEMLDGDRGVLVPFRQSATIAAAVISLLTNPKRRSAIQEAAYEVGKTMSWINVAHQYFHLYHYANGSTP